jgi:hypothetical protein
MAFKGTLKEFKVPDILQLISLQKKTGILTFNSADGFITLIFEEGFIVGIDAFPKKLEMRVGNVFVKQGLISEEMLQRALAIQKRTGQKIGEILTGMGLIDEQTIPEALKTQATQIVLSLFNWKKGEYNFKVLENIDEPLKSLQPISVDNLIMEGVQMLDEWPLIKRIIPSDDLIFEPVLLGTKKIKVVSEYDDDADSHGTEHTIHVSETEVNLLKYVNGANTVKDIVEMGLFTEYRIYKTLFNLVNKGLIRKKEKAAGGDTVARELENVSIQENVRRIQIAFRVLLAALLLLFALNLFHPFRPFHRGNALVKKPLIEAVLPSAPGSH